MDPRWNRFFDAKTLNPELVPYPGVGAASHPGSPTGGWSRQTLNPKLVPYPESGCASHPPPQDGGDSPLKTGFTCFSWGWHRFCNAKTLNPKLVPYPESGCASHPRTGGPTGRGGCPLNQNRDGFRAFRKPSLLTWPRRSRLPQPLPVDARAEGSSAWQRIRKIAARFAGKGRGGFSARAPDAWASTLQPRRPRRASEYLRLNALRYSFEKTLTKYHDWNSIHSMSNPNLLTSRQAAEILHVTPRRVLALARSRGIGWHVDGLGWLFRPDEIDLLRIRKPGYPAGRPRKQESHES
jgi:hypothetical protein